MPKTIALATFSSDPISSTAYATEEILFVTAVGGVSLVSGLTKLIPAAIASAILLAIVVTSMQTIMASGERCSAGASYSGGGQRGPTTSTRSNSDGSALG